MKKLSQLFAVILVVIAFCSCGETKPQFSIVGNWQGTEWLVNGKPSDNNATSTSFNFDEKGAYTFINAGNTEKGTYKVENDMLFTTPTGQQEIMVKIAKLTKDSLVFDMNRGGQSESLTLLKK